MNHLNFNDWVEIFSAIMMALSAFAAFFAARSSKAAVIEMQASRRANEKPVIHLVKNLETAHLQLAENFQPTVFSTVGKKLVRPSILLKNIGLGDCYETTFSFSDEREPISFDEIDFQSIAEINKMLSNCDHVIEHSEYLFSISNKRGGATRFNSFGYHRMALHHDQKFPKFTNQTIEAKSEIRFYIPEQIFLDRFMRLISGYVKSKEFANGHAYQDFRSSSYDCCINVQFKSLSGEKFVEKIRLAISCHIWGEVPTTNLTTAESARSDRSEFHIRYYIDSYHEHQV